MPSASTSLLLALSRHPELAQELTGRDNLHWQRMLNWQQRSWAVERQRGAMEARAELISSIEHGGFTTPRTGGGGRTRRRVTVTTARNRRADTRRAHAAAVLAELRLAAAVTPRRIGAAPLPLPIATRQLSWHLAAVAPASAAAQMVLAHAHAQTTPAAPRSAALVPVPPLPTRTLPTGHPLLLPPVRPPAQPPTRTAFEESMAVASDAAAAAFDAASATEAVPLDAAAAAAIDAAAIAEVGQNAKPARLPLLQAVGLGVGCGGISGVLSRAIVHPLDTLRVLQSVSSNEAAAQVIRESDANVSMRQRLTAASEHYVQTAGRAWKDARHLARSAVHNWHLGPASNPLYDTLQLSKSLGILYRGYALSVLGAQPVFALYFGAYEAAKIKLSEAFPNQSSSLVQIASGFFAECVAVTLWNPWEVVRQRMQLETARRTVFQTAEDVIKESGPRGLYQGLGGYIALWGTYSPLMFLLYEQGIGFIYRPRAGDPQPPSGAVIAPSISTSFMVGSFAGFVASCITSPLDVVKTRMQVQTPTSVIRYDSVFHGLQEIFNNEGPSALFRGTMARALNNGLSTGIMLGCYGVLRANMARRLGHGSAADDADSSGWNYQPSAAPPRPGLRAWYTENDERAPYDEGAWPAVPVPPPAPPAGPPTADGTPPAVVRRDPGFIRPLPWLSAIERTKGGGSGGGSGGAAAPPGGGEG